MDLHYKQEIAVGGMVIVAIVILFAGLTFLTGGALRGGGQTVTARFDDVSGLTEGDPVQVSGVQVGRVVDMALDGANRVLVRLEVPGDMAPHADAEVMLEPLDLFGAQRIAYRPGTADQMLDEGAVIAGTRRVPITENAGELTDQAAEVLTGLRRLASEENIQQLHRTLQATSDAMAAIAAATRGPLVGQASDALETIQLVGDRMDSLLGSREIEMSLERFDSVTTALQSMTASMAAAAESMDSILSRIERGEGSVGMAVTDSTLAVEAREAMRSLRLLLDDVRDRPGRYINARVSIF